ncbi:MAG: PQQ-binding-like beta-propeller repeat protein [Planctomycetota bacterium]
MRPSVLAVVLMLASAPGVRAADTLWMSLRGTCEGGAVCRWPAEEEPPQIREWHFTSKTSRRYKMGLAVWASPACALVGGRPMIFIGGCDQTLHALDLLDKERVWFKLTNGEIASAPAVGLVEGQQVVFWGSADRTVYAHFAKTGGRLWTRELVKATNTMDEAALSAPLLHDGTLFITCFAYDKALARSNQKGWLFALDMATGAVRWRYEVSQGPMSSPAGRILNGRFVVFVAARKGLLQAIDAAGPLPQRLWTFQMPHEVLGSPVIEGDTDNPALFLGSKFGNLIAIDARTGRERWERMAGNWIDNTACVGEIDGERVVFVGSHDYYLYAFRAADGEELWRKRLGGEVYSAPAFFHFEGEPAVVAGALDNRLYVMNARDGKVIVSYHTGTPVWDKVTKGDTLWASPVALEAGAQTAIIHGSFGDAVYVFPLNAESPFRTRVQSPRTLWYALGLVAVAFLGVVLPIIIVLPVGKEQGAR